MRGMILASVALATVAIATSAQATIFSVTYTGTVASGTDDSGVFGAAGASLAGLFYTSMYEYDDGIGLHDYGPNALDQIYGGANYGIGTPSLGATLTVNGITFSFNGERQASHSNFPLGGTIRSYVSSAAALGTFNYSFMGNHMAAAGIPTPMATPFAALGTPATGGLNDFQIAYGIGNTSSSHATGTLAPTSVTVAPVPEPATWAMFIGGFGLIGAAMRGRKRREVAA